MVVLLPDRMAQSVMPMAVSVDPLVKLGVQMRLLQGVFVRRSVFQFLQLFVGFPADGGGGGFLEEQRLRGWGRWRRWRRWSDQLPGPGTLGAPEGALFLV